MKIATAISKLQPLVLILCFLCIVDGVDDTGNLEGGVVVLGQRQESESHRSLRQRPNRLQYYDRQLQTKQLASTKAPYDGTLSTKAPGSTATIKAKASSLDSSKAPKSSAKTSYNSTSTFHKVKSAKDTNIKSTKVPKSSSSSKASGTEIKSTKAPKSSSQPVSSKAPKASASTKAPSSSGPTAATTSPTAPSPSPSGVQQSYQFVENVGLYCGGGPNGTLSEDNASDLEFQDTLLALAAARITSIDDEEIISIVSVEIIFLPAICCIDNSCDGNTTVESSMQVTYVLLCDGPCPS